MGFDTLDSESLRLSQDFQSLIGRDRKPAVGATPETAQARVLSHASGLGVPGAGTLKMQGDRKDDLFVVAAAMRPSCPTMSCR